MGNLFFLLALLILFVTSLRVADVVFILISRMLPKRQRLMVYNWLCTNVFIEEEE